MDALEIIDTAIRGAAIGTLLLCGLLVMRDAGLSRKKYALPVLCVGLCAYLIVSSPGLSLSPSLLRVILLGIAGIVPVLVYWAILELFLDDLSFDLWQIIIAIIIVVAAWLTLAGLPLGAVRGIGVLALFAHGLWVVLSGSAGDLVEARRSFRPWFLIWVIVVGAVTTTLEVSQVDRHLPAWVFVIQAGLFWITAVAFVLWLVQPRGSVWLAASEKPDVGSSISPVQRALIGRVEAAMADGIWRTEGLTVAQLAAELSTQEHRLRAAINQGLGYRNFTTFINGYRVAEAKRLLVDPDLAERTILSIAYDVGFASVGPFNRSFRMQAGMSPTEFRQKNLRV